MPVKKDFLFLLYADLVGYSNQEWYRDLWQQIPEVFDIISLFLKCNICTISVPERGSSDQ